MTKATRWGVSALMVIGGLSLGSFVGCSDDDPTPPPVDEDTGPLPDTAKTETGTPETAPADMGTDTGPVAADRAATLVFASPDLGSKFVCFGAFIDDPATKDEPLQTLPPTGAVGVPDPAAPTDYTKTTAFPYGAVVPIPLTDAAIAALDNFNFVVYLLDANPAASGKTCTTSWKDIKGDTSRWKSFAKNTVKKGDHGVIAFQGCKTATGCGMGAFEIKLHMASMAKPTEAGANIGFQFLHLSQFAGATLPLPLDAGTATVPGFQSSDVYVLPGPDTADAGTAAAIKIATDVKYGDAVTALKGATLPAGTKNDASRLIIAVRSGGMSSACTNPIPMGQAGSPPSGSCPNWTFYLKPFIDGGKYAALGGGLEYPNTNQLFIIAGSPVDSPTMPSMRIMIARGNLPGKSW